ncbi:MAG: hypothetical protein HC866_25660 [Leptolyngbyaceae cyanobacterium RU_5_1]|nr:hypothetical protein [Leptolyngbyaceae cyanobacterium RU_5_1]
MKRKSAQRVEPVMAKRLRIVRPQKSRAQPLPVRRKEDTTPKLITPEPKPRRKWHLAYHLLAAFNVLVVSTSLHLNHQMTAVYTESVQANQQWTNRRNHLSELGTLASKVNAPGNDVFATHNVPVELERMRAALSLFNQQMASIQAEFQQSSNSEVTVSVLADLKEVDRRMAEMVSEANLIFSYLQRHQPKEAGKRMAIMDRKYANLTTALHSLQTKASQIQEQLLGEQSAIVASSDKLQYSVAIVVLLMVGGAALYGCKLAKQMHRDEIKLEDSMRELRRTQAHLIQSEKMSSLGQLVAGIAHEMNNPVSFIYGNVSYAQGYTRDLLKIIKLYQQHYPELPKTMQAEIEAVDLEFLETDFPRLLTSMKVGSERIQKIVKSLHTFAHLNEAEIKVVDIHSGIDSTLMLLKSRLKAQPILASDVDYLRPEIIVTKDFGKLLPVECYPDQLNQVFLYILNNAIEALDRLNQQRTPAEIEASLNQIHISTEVFENKWVAIHIADTGPGVSETIKSRLFDPFFTTKPVGQGTGLGLSICYQIVVETHGGDIQCSSTPGYGTEFVVKIPICQQAKPICQQSQPPKRAGMDNTNRQSSSTPAIAATSRAIASPLLTLAPFLTLVKPLPHRRLG